jgi:hypothetical protein
MQLQERPLRMPPHSEWFCQTESTQLRRRWKGTVPLVKGLEMGRSLREFWLSCCLQVKGNVCG